MTRDEKAFLIALVIGDGHIHLNKLKTKANTGTLNIIHSSKQREWMEYKAERCNKILGGKQVIVRSIDNNGYPGLVYNKTNRYFGILHNFIYKSKKKIYTKSILKRLTIESFAVWWMDDGCLSPKKRNGKIHAYQGFLNTYEDWDTNELIADIFQEKFGVRPLIRKDKGSYRLEFNTTKLKVLLPILEKYSIPSMSYKFKFCTSAQPLEVEGDDIV